MFYRVASLALIPTLGVVSLLGSAASGASVWAVLRLLRARAHEVQRRISRRLSSGLISVGSNSDWSIIRRVLRRHRADFLKLFAALFSLKGMYSLRKALHGFDSSIRMNDWDQELDDDLKKRFELISLPPWGDGVPVPPSPGVWRPYLLTAMTALENLHEMHGLCGILARSPTEMTIDQMTEGVRRILFFKYHDLQLQTSMYWSMEQARSIAEALAKDCHLAMPLPTGALEECGPQPAPLKLVEVSPKWSQALQRFSLNALRPFYHAVLSWRSRYVDTPFGKMHVLDTCPISGSPSSSKSAPPVLLQHGAFVTGWSMTLLGWLLHRQGRRVIMPDLFDFDHGYSASDQALTGGRKVRQFDEHVEALSYVVKDILEGLSTTDQSGEVDIIGHSFGGVLVAHLATCCAKKGYPVRKVVMLSPGGPFIKVFDSPMASRLMGSPWETLETIAPTWVPFMLVKAVVKFVLSVVCSPNNFNTVLGLSHKEYFGKIDGLGSDKPVLLLWGDKDAVCNPRSELANFLTERFPHTDGFWIEGADHNIQIDSVVAIARKIDIWLSGSRSLASQSLSQSLIDKLLWLTDRKLTPMTLGKVSHGEVLDASRSKL